MSPADSLNMHDAAAFKRTLDEAWATFREQLVQAVTGSGALGCQVSGFWVLGLMKRLRFDSFLTVLLFLV